MMFEEHRKELKKALLPTPRQLLLERCARVGESEAIRAIERSIVDGYSDIYVKEDAPRKKMTMLEVQDRNERIQAWAEYYRDHPEALPENKA